MAPKKSLLSRIQHKSPFRPKTLADFPDAPDPLYPPPMPILAFVRPRPLTAESQDFSGSADSAFFNKLPSDIRSKILRFAFGYWGIHVELDFNHPDYKMRSMGVTEDGFRVARSPLYVRDDRSCPDTRDDGYMWHRYVVRVDKRQPKQWHWWSGICCRHFSVFEIPQLYVGNFRSSIDTCRTRDFDWWQGAYNGEMMKSIGVMGLMLSCRQAYAEAVHILYTANSFILSNTELILNLPRLLLPSRLASIASLEMVWKVHPFRPQEPDDSALTDHDTFLRLIDVTPQIFPALRCIYISLRGDMYTDPTRRTDEVYNFSDEAYTKVETVVVKPMEAMFQKLEKLQIAVIGLPSSCYGPRKQRAMDAGLEVFEDRFDKVETFWRDAPHIQTKGYWIRLDHRDMGGGNYSMPGCYMGGDEAPPGPLDCLYGNSLSPW